MVANRVISPTKQFNWLCSAAQHWRWAASFSNPGLFALLCISLSLITHFWNSLTIHAVLFVCQEQQRYNQPHKAFTFRMHGFESVVGPVKGVFDKEMSLNKAREHTLLRSDRPPYVTILSLGQTFCFSPDTAVTLLVERLRVAERKPTAVLNFALTVFQCEMQQPGYLMVKEQEQRYVNCWKIHSFWLQMSQVHRWDIIDIVLFYHSSRLIYFCADLTLVCIRAVFLL